MACGPWPHPSSFDLCWAYEFTDPWGNRFELNTYDYDRVRAELIDGDGVVPVRYWPAELLDEWRGRRTTEQSARSHIP